MSSSYELTFGEINFQLIIFYCAIGGNLIGFGYFLNSSNFLNLFYFILNFYSAARFIHEPCLNYFYCLQIASKHLAFVFITIFFTAEVYLSPPLESLS